MEVNNGANIAAKDAAGIAAAKDAASIAASQEAQIKHQIDMNIAETAKYKDLARQALLAGKEDDARIFIEKKQFLEAAKAMLDTVYANIVNTRRMSEEFMGNVRSQMINVSTTVTKNGQIINQTSYTAKPQSRMDIFRQMDSEGDRMLEEATAMFAKLNTAAAVAGFNNQPKDEAEALAEKYAAEGSAASAEKEKDAALSKSSVDEELEKMKKDMGL